MVPSTTEQPARGADRLRASLALALGLAAVLRVVAHAFLDRRPRFGGSEASDLCNLMFHHYSLQGYFGWSFLEHLSELGYKPPLYYGGLPLLLSGWPSLSYPPLLLVNALALGLLLVGCWRLGLRLGGARAGLAAVLVTAALPAVSGRATIVGVELSHMACLAWSLELALVLLTGRPKRSHAVLLGLIVGAGMLMKWTLAIPLSGVLLVAAFSLWHAPDRLDRARLMGAAAAISTLLFLSWVFTLARFDRFAEFAGSEASTAELLGHSPWTYLPHWMVTSGMGLAAVPVVLLALAPRRWPGRVETDARPSAAWTGWMLVAAVLSVLVIHTFVPHKEIRYLLPAFVGVGVLLGAGLARSSAGPLWTRALGFAAVALLWLSSFALPYLPDGSPPGSYAELKLHPRIVTHDSGLERLVLHPTFLRESGSIVSYTLSGERWIELRDLLSWELYARNATPVISRLPEMSEVNETEAARALDLSTHFISNRDLSPSERLLLEGRGFTRIHEDSLPLPEAQKLELWARSR